MELCVVLGWVPPLRDDQQRLHRDQGVLHGSKEEGHHPSQGIFLNRYFPQCSVGWGRGWGNRRSTGEMRIARAVGVGPLLPVAPYQGIPPESSTLGSNPRKVLHAGGPGSSEPRDMEGALHEFITSRYSHHIHTIAAC